MIATQDKKNRFEKNTIKILLVFLLIVFILSLAGLEKYLSFKNSSNNIVNNKGSKRYIRLREHPPLMINIEIVKVSGSEQRTSKFRIDENGFIQPSKIYNNPDMNIFFIGGSTTECATINEENRFPYLTGRLLDKELNKKVNSFNGGVGGNNSMHSINILLNKIIPLEPDIVVMMHNINDMAILWHEGTYWNHSTGRSLIIQPPPPSFYNVIRESTINHIFPQLYSRIEAIIMKLIPERFDEFAHVRGANKIINKDYSSEQFRQNLETFISICRIRGIIPVLMTQENRLKENPDEFIKTQVAHYGIDYSLFKEIFDSFNEVIREVGQNTGVLVIDLAKEIPQDAQYITDFVHFNDAGSKLASEIITRKLVDHLKQLQKS